MSADNLIEEPGGPREWLIRKGGHFYRPGRSGYTTVKSQAGRYTELDARREAGIEPWHMDAIHQDMVPDPVGDLNVSEIASLKALLAATQAEILRMKAALVDIELDIHLASGIAGYDLKPALAKIRAIMVEELPARSLDGEEGA